MNATQFFNAVNATIKLYVDGAAIDSLMTTETQSSWKRGTFQVRSLELEDGTARLFFFDNPSEVNPLPIQRIVALDETGACKAAPDIAEFLMTGKTAAHRP
jgi:hypothetical protein